MARLKTPFREHLAKHFADTYSRIELPEPYATHRIRRRCTVSDVFGRAIKHRRASGALVRPPASESKIEETFAALEFPLSDEVRYWYSLADSFEEIDENSCLWWWPLERMSQENQHPRRDAGCLWYADHLICSSVYCLGPSNGNTSTVWIDEGHPWMGCPPDIRYTEASPRFERKTDSVATFVEKLLQSPDDADPYMISWS